MFLPFDIVGEASCGIVTAKREGHTFFYVVYSRRDVRELCAWYQEDATKAEAVSIESALLSLDQSSLPESDLRQVIVVNDTAAAEYESLLATLTNLAQTHVEVMGAGLDLEDNVVLQFSAMDTPGAAELPYGTCEFQYEGEPCTVIFYGRDQGLELITELAWMACVDGNFIQNAARVLAMSLLPETAPRDAIRIDGFAGFIINLAYKKTMMDEIEELEAKEPFAADAGEYIN